ncbi:MAG: biotin--[acetyl-CoA-carboxylase] ligase, partial [Chloroflexota bacterium]
PRTSIAVSIILRPRLAPAELPRLSMAAAIAAIEAIRESTGVAAALKWPNDVVTDRGKLGGILAESALAGGSVLYVILGIGLNGNLDAEAVGPLPDAAMQPTTLQDEAGQPISREAVVIALLRAFDRAYALLRAGDATAMWQQYRVASNTLGHLVRIRPNSASVDLLDPVGTVEGIAEDVTPDGALVVRLPSGGRQTFAYGEVTVRT